MSIKWTLMIKSSVDRAKAPAPKPRSRVFIVDDHPILSEVLADMLNRTDDFTVVGVATDGERALKQLEGLSVDILLLDLMLPGMGGLELLEAVRATRAQMKVVMCSGVGGDNAIMEAYSQGVSAYVEKSTGVDELFSTLRAVAAGKFPLNSRMGGLIRAQVRRRKAFKPLAAGDLLILRRLSNGQSLKEIAGELGISASGVYKARARIKARMNIKGAAGFFHVAMSLGLVYPAMTPEGPSEPGPDGLSDGAISS